MDIEREIEEMDWEFEEYEDGEGDDIAAAECREEYQEIARLCDMGCGPWVVSPMSHKNDDGEYVGIHSVNGFGVYVDAVWDSEQMLWEPMVGIASPTMGMTRLLRGFEQSCYTKEAAISVTLSLIQSLRDLDSLHD